MKAARKTRRMPTSSSHKEKRGRKQHHSKEPRPSLKGQPSRGHLSVSKPHTAAPAVHGKAGGGEGRREKPVTHNFTFYFQVHDEEAPNYNYPDVGPRNYEYPPVDHNGRGYAGERAVTVVGDRGHDMEQGTRPLRKLSNTAWDGRTKYPKPVADPRLVLMPYPSHGWCGRNKGHAASYSDWGHDRSFSQSGSAKDGWICGCSGRHLALLTLCVVVFVALGMLIAYGVIYAEKESDSGNGEEETYPPLSLPGFHSKSSNDSMSEEPPTALSTERADDEPPVDTNPTAPEA